MDDSCEYNYFDENQDLSGLGSFLVSLRSSSPSMVAVQAQLERDWITSHACKCQRTSYPFP